MGIAKTKTQCGVAGVILAASVLMVTPALAQSTESEHRLSQGVTVAVGLGGEVTHGDYGSSADATVATLPVVVAVNPSDTVDTTLELPLVIQSSKSGSGFVVTQAGGMGRRGAGSTAMTTTTTTASSTVTEAGLGDINLSAGWTLLQDDEHTPKLRPTFYLKLPSGDRDRGLGTGTIEAGPGLSVSKWLGDFQLFAEAAYILQDSNAVYAGKNYLSYSAGGGMQATDRLFVSLYAKGSSARVDGGAAPVEARAKLNFLLSRRISWEAYALAGFSDASPDAGGGLLVMYQF